LLYLYSLNILHPGTVACMSLILNFVM